MPPSQKMVSSRCTFDLYGNEIIKKEGKTTVQHAVEIQRAAKQQKKEGEEEENELINRKFQGKKTKIEVHNITWRANL